MTTPLLKATARASDECGCTAQGGSSRSAPQPLAPNYRGLEMICDQDFRAVLVRLRREQPFVGVIGDREVVNGPEHLAVEIEHHAGALAVDL